MTEKEKIKKEIELIKNEREVLNERMKKIDTSEEKLSLLLQDFKLWTQEDRLKDKLLTPELIKEKEKLISELETKMDKLNKKIKLLQKEEERAKSQELKKKINDEEWENLDLYRELDWQCYHLKWELMTEEEREKKKDAIISMNKKWGNF